MLFRVPMPYTVKGTIKGKRNPSEDSYWEYVEVDIPVLNDEIAPVAVVWEDSLPTTDPMSSLHDRDSWAKGKNMVPEDGEQMTRLFNGEHYLRRYDRLTPEGLAASLNPNNNYHLLHKDVISHRQTDREHPVSDVPYRDDRPFESDFQEKREELRKRAEQFFIIGNDIFGRASEPVIIKETYKTGDSFAVVPRIVPVHTVEKNRTTFRLDRYAEVVASCNEIEPTRFSRIRQKASKVGMERAPKIFTEEAVAYDDIKENLVNAARNYIGRSSEHTRLKDVNPYYGRAYLNLKIGLEQYDLTGNLDALEDACVDLIENHAHEIRYANIDTAYSEYANRPVHGGMGLAPR